MDSPARFKVVVAGRRCGKSRFAIVSTLISALKCKDTDASVVYIAPTISMVKVLAWDALMTMGRPVIASSNINEGRIKLVNGVSIYCRGADSPDTLRGMKMAFAVLDETKDLKDNVFEMIVRPALSDIQGGALIIGTPSPDATQFRQYFDFGKNDESGEWGAWHKTTYDNPLIPRAEIEAAKRTLSTSAFEQEYMASWDTTGANILRLEWFATAEAPRGQYSTYIAVDPAGYENVSGDDQKKKHLDYFAIAVVRVYDDGHWWVQKIDYGRWDVRESAVRVLMAIRNHKPICVGIEKGALMRALMPYLTDLMRKNGLYAHIEEIPHGGQSKANRITYALQGLLEHGRITFNPKENWDELKREMLAFPSTRVHDDVIESLAMCAHLAETVYAKPDDTDTFEVIDEVCGF
jgi:phage terminase large subunit-like protein